MHKHILTAVALTLLIGCDSGNRGNPYDTEVGVKQKDSATVELSRKFIFHVGSATIKFLDYKICEESIASCEQSILILDKSNKVISRANGHISNFRIKPVLTATLLKTTENKYTKYSEETLDLQTLKSNFKDLNYQMLGLCRASVRWQEMLDLANTDRSALYFHFSNENMDNSKVQYRVDSVSGQVTEVVTSFVGSIHSRNDPTVVVSAVDVEGNPAVDNMLITFGYHSAVCETAYEIVKSRPYVFNEKIDMEASRWADQDRTYKNTMVKFPGVSLTSVFTIESLMEIKIDTTQPSVTLPQRFRTSEKRK